MVFFSCCGCSLIGVIRNTIDLVIVLMATNKIKHRRSKNKIDKINLVFDEEKRREFLTGFHKRKLLRKKKGQEKLENELKDERKRLKIKAKESYRNLVLSNRKIPELENTYNEVYDDDDDLVTIEIKELVSNLHNNTTSPILSKCNKSKDDNADQEYDIIPKQQRKENGTLSNSSDQLFTSKKDVRRKLRKMATKNLQNSKIFKKKNKVEKQKQKKKSLKQKNEEIKQQRKLKKKHKYKKHP